MIYNPSNWYWCIGGNQTQFWSSAGNAYVPASDATYTAWQQAGGVATNIDTMANLQTVLEAANVPPYAPVTPLQARKALNQAGLLAQVNAAVAAADANTQMAWEYASVINRTDPMITAIGTTLNLTPAALDHLFILAATL